MIALVRLLTVALAGPVAYGAMWLGYTVSRWRDRKRAEAFREWLRK